VIAILKGSPFAAWDKDEAPKNELLVDNENRLGVITTDDEWVFFTEEGVEVVNDTDDLRFSRAVGSSVTITGPIPGDG